MEELYTHLNADELTHLTRKLAALQFQEADLESVHKRRVARTCREAVAAGKLTADEASKETYRAMEGSPECKHPFALPAELEAALEDLDRLLHPEKYMPQWSRCHSRLADIRRS